MPEIQSRGPVLNRGRDVYVVENLAQIIHARAHAAYGVAAEAAIRLHRAARLRSTLREVSGKCLGEQIAQPLPVLRRGAKNSSLIKTSCQPGVCERS